jgi:hypothetical protein
VVLRLETAAVALVQAGQPAPAARIVGFIDHERERTGLVIQPPDESIRDEAIDEGRRQLGPDWDVEAKAGAAMTLEEAVDFALSEIAAS